jgi:hypothetical protein
MNPILSLQGRVTATGALVITIVPTEPASAPNPLATLPGMVDSTNRLVVMVE